MKVTQPIIKESLPLSVETINLASEAIEKGKQVYLLSLIWGIGFRVTNFLATSKSKSYLVCNYTDELNILYSCLFETTRIYIKE